MACCDEDIIGRTFTEGKLKLTPDSKFYGHSVSNISDALVLLETAEMFNLVGARIVRAAIEKGLVHPDAVITIGGVPHVQAMRL